MKMISFSFCLSTFFFFFSSLRHLNIYSMSCIMSGFQ